MNAEYNIDENILQVENVPDWLKNFITNVINTRFIITYYDMKNREIGG